MKSLVRPMCLVMLAWLVLHTAGCKSEFKLEKYVELNPLQQHFWTLQSVEQDQPVAVTADSRDVIIDLYIVEASSREQAEDVLRKRSFEGILASKLDTASPRLETTLKAWTGYTVVVKNASRDRTARVTVRFTGR